MLRKEKSETISVVVPVYNRENLVTRCLDSIYSQTYRPIHLIVVDNNSTDKSMEIVREWIERHNSQDFTSEILHEKIRGAAAARQKGFESVITDKVMFFDSDDVMRPEVIEKAMDLFLKDNNLDLVFWSVMLHSLDGKMKKSHRSNSGNLLDNHIVHSILRTQGYMVKSEFIRNVGGWRIDCMCWNDWELGIRLLTSIPKTAFLDYIGADVFSQADSITGTDFSSKTGEWEKTIDMAEASIPSADGLDTTHLLGMLDYRRIILAAIYYREGRKDYAAGLLKKTLSGKRIDMFRKILLQIIYHYTAKGGRGAFFLWKYLSVIH